MRQGQQQRKSTGTTPTPAALRDREDRVIARALRIIEQRAAKHGPEFGDRQSCGTYFRLRLGNEVREHFEVAFLDARHRLIAVERLFSGTISSSEVHPRIVVQRALALNAAAVVLAHNHPSGHAEPSIADRAITSRLKDVLAVVDVRLLDHFIVTAHKAVAMSSRGLL